MGCFMRKTKPPSRTIFGEYCATSSVHGVRYFSDPERTLCEKFWWIVMFFASVGGCAMLIDSAWKQWKQMPIVVNFENQLISVTDIPFPAFTICPAGKTSKFVPMDKFVENCAFNGPSSCEFLLNYVVTDAGTCVSFNMLQKHRMLRNGSVHSNESYNNFGNNGTIDALQYNTTNTTLTKDPHHVQEVSEERDFFDVWIPEEGYTRSQTNGCIPLRGQGAGKYRAFDLVLACHKKYKCNPSDKTELRGHKMVLHSPADYPLMINSVVIPFEHVTQIAVKPLIVKTNPDLRRYPPEKRQCFFEDERYLNYFLIYTQNNCEAECLSNFTRARCGCVPSGMMRSEEIEVCEPAVPCYHHAITEFVTIDNPYRRVYGGKIPKLNAFDFRNKCNCLPSCTSYRYDFEILQHSFKSNGNIDGVSA